MKPPSVWPLQYLTTVKEVKIFGGFILNSYRCLLKRNWDYRYGKFEQVLLTWTSRSLDTLVQRVDVVNIFALSKIFYIASVLPLSKTVSKKFDQAIGKFLWKFSGKVLRVPLNEIKLPRGIGGLGLICLYFMAKSLKLSPIMRLLKCDDEKSVRHLGF